MKYQSCGNPNFKADFCSSIPVITYVEIEPWAWLHIRTQGPELNKLESSSIGYAK